MIWWWELGCKDGYTSNSVIKFCCQVNIRSKNGEEDSNICIGWLITCCKPNCDYIFSIALASLLVMSLLHKIAKDYY